MGLNQRELREQAERNRYRAPTRTKPAEKQSKEEPND